VSEEYNTNGDEGRGRVDEVRRFWRHVYGKGRERGQLFLCVASAERGADGLEGGLHQEFFPYPAKSRDAAIHALRESDRGREVYHAVHLLTDAERKKRTAAQVWALWADLDGAPVPEDPKPTAVIESSPGRFHVYLRLLRPIDPEQAEALSRRLTYAIGADKGKWALATLLRPPHTRNHKRAEPSPVAVVGFDAGRAWDPDELDRILPGRPAASANGHASATNGHATDEPPVRLRAAGLRIWRGEDTVSKPTGEINRSDSLFRIGAVLNRAGASERVIAEALKERDEALGWNKYTDRPDRDVQYATIAAKVADGSHQQPDPAKLAPSFHRTDLGNAERLIERHGDDLRYVHLWKKWLVWDGKRWALDESGEVERRAVGVVASIYAEAASVSDSDERKALSHHAQRSEARSRIDAMIALARSMVPAAPNDLDTDPWVLNVQNGTVALRTGDLRPHRRGDLITKVTPVKYDPDAQAPRFTRFLQEIFASDEGLIAFVQRFAGYSLTGSTQERAFAILHGVGKNGKSTLVELLMEVMGDYATATDTETLLVKRYQGVGNDVAALRGARFVQAAEVEQGRALAESKVKNLTGSDTITARFLFAEPFSFKPEFKLWLSTNNKPVIRGTDDAIWDRIRLIPFDQRFTGKRRDPKLPEKLRAELPGVLAWMVRGCTGWQRDGLGWPEKVANATAGYRAEMDTLGAFFDDRCVLHPRAEAPATPLYKAYQEWCADNGEADESQRRFGGRLGERGFVSFTYTAGPHMDRKGWRGIGLRDDHHDDGPGGAEPPPEQPVTPDEQTRTSDAKHDQGAPEAPKTGDDRPVPDKPPDDRPVGESRIGIGDSPESLGRPDDPGRKIHNPAPIAPRVEGLLKNGPVRPVRPATGVTRRDARSQMALVRAAFEDERQGPAKNLRYYHAGRTSLEILTNSVLQALGVEWARGLGPAERGQWESIVEAVAGGLGEREM
jgi:P4 family phage/plasmid primase-like protien